MIERQKAQHMKVKYLLEILQECNPDDVVIMSRDAEGNGYSPLADYSDEYNYLAESDWAGDIYPRDSNNPDWDYIPQGDGEIGCVVLWPVN